MADKPNLGPDEQFCSSCGEVIKKKAEICPKCGVRLQNPSENETGNNEQKKQNKEKVEKTLREEWEGRGPIGKIVYVVRTIFGLFLLLLIAWGIFSYCSGEEQASVSTDVKSTTAGVVATATFTPVPVFFSDEQASAFLLKPNDFPKNWTAKKNGLFLDAKNNYLTDYNVQMIKITLATHETEAAARAAFSTKKSEAQATIDGRGISGDTLEDIKKYPLFVWNASPQASMQGVEKWTVIGVYGNITMKVYNEGSVGAPKKKFAIDIAKKQVDKIRGD